MAERFMEYEVRYTDAIYGRHLLVQNGVLWIGKQGVLENVMKNKNVRIIHRLVELVHESLRTGRSVEWTP